MQPGRRWQWYLLAAFLASACVAVAVFWPRNGPDGVQPSGELPPLEMTYDGPSASLARTAILPTLDTPIPAGSSAVWCGSFQLAWNELKAGGPVAVAGRDDLARRLSASTFSSAELSPGTHYAAAGLRKDGIVEKIRSDMARLFPGVPVPELGPGEVGVAYAYLRASVPFRLPYYEENLTFRDSAGREMAVRAFGLRQRDENSAMKLRGQIEVLFAKRVGWGEDPTEFAFDLCRDSSPDQVVVARLPRRGTLGEAVAEVGERARREREKGGTGHFSITDHLLVPAMAWRVEHRFAELEGPERRLAGGKFDGLYISRALQVIQFRLDRSGADLASEARIMVKGGPTRFLFDGPFLVYMKRRGAPGPYFVMWVDNAELLAPWK
jgi:hypothetical protein